MYRLRLKKLFVQNLAHKKTEKEREAMAEVILTFHYGLQAELNLKVPRAGMERKIEAFIAALSER